MWLLPTGTHALWQNIFGVTFEVNEPTIISTPCQLILERQAFAVKEMLLTKEALPFRVKTKTELCCLYSEIVLIIAKAENVFQANTFYGFFYLVVLSLEMDASVLIDHISKFGELHRSTIRNTLDFSTFFQS